MSTSNTTTGPSEASIDTPSESSTSAQREPWIAVDAMSGDGGAEVAVAGVAEALRMDGTLKLILVGDPEWLEAAIARHALDTERCRVEAASDVVSMNDSAAVALRNRKKSSMRIAIDLVKRGEAAAAVSAGNTGALMAMGRFVLKTVPGIDRPAICTTIPAIGGYTHMLDLGANVDSSAQHLYQFALMGCSLAIAIDGNSAPRVGLLNIGSEDIKGNEQVKEAAQLIQGDSGLNYIGFVEGNDIYTDAVDVVVCDGFVGNVSLKTSEGVARMISHYLREEFKRNLLNRMVALLAMPVLKAFRNRIDPRLYNGASLLGLDGVVIKSHGSADAVAFANAIGIARKEIEHDVPGLIRARLQAQLAGTSLEQQRAEAV